MEKEKPSYHKNEEFINRSQKLKEIKELNIDPYPHKFEISSTFEDLNKKSKDKKEIGHSDDAASGNTETFKVAGRLVLFRAMGKNAFGQLQDETGKLQIMFNRDLTKVEGLNTEKISSIKFIEKKLDLGDIIGIEGNIFRTMKGELTIFAKKVVLLCKTLLPLPEKHKGLLDKGIRYRKRWLDLISHKETIDTFILRNKIIKEIRRFLDDSDFLEVETPILQNAYGGAEAKPFKTHLNALDQDVFLRISLEIPLKKLIVGGFLKVYELGKVFRNEGLDRTHNPEFTELEAYSAYWDYNDLMVFIEKLFETISLKILNTTKIEIEGQVIDVKAPWIRMTMKESIKKYANIDVNSLKDEELKNILKNSISQEELKEKTRGELIAHIFEEKAEEHLIQPHHITDHPIETTPLCKLHRGKDEKKERLVERFESFILKREFVNAYTELNDPILQRELLEKQASKKDDSKNPLDEDFIESICQGLPPTGGFGVGIDRLIMLFTKALSIRDVILFPIMKKEDS